jgi:hypothetical protein
MGPRAAAAARAGGGGWAPKGSKPSWREAAAAQRCVYVVSRPARGKEADIPLYQPIGRDGEASNTSGVRKGECRPNSPEVRGWPVHLETVVASWETP